MALTKPRGGWRYEHLLELPDDGKRYEIIDGELYEMPSPSWIHQVILDNLMALLRPLAVARGSRMFVAPLDLFLAGGRPVQPDLFYLGPNWKELRTGRGIEGVPELVIEILSPSNPDHDRVRKRELYARAGVQEYWLVDPEARVIEVLALRDGEYEQHARAEGQQPVRSSVFPELSFTAELVFADVDAEV